MLERDPFARAQAGRGGEDDHRPVEIAEVVGERVDLRPRLERALLGVLAPRVVDAGLGRVRVDDLPCDRAVKHLVDAHNAELPAECRRAARASSTMPTGTAATTPSHHSDTSVKASAIAKTPSKSPRRGRITALPPPRCLRTKVFR
jgi:hypothetical protein